MQLGVSYDQWDKILEFWFPEGRALDIDPYKHAEYWRWRMLGGADEEIIARFSSIAAIAAKRKLDHWALDPHGRLALIVILDQFSRSVWRNSPQAYAQDGYALSLVNEGLQNGHYSALETPWYRIAFGLPLGHCEGDDHLARIDRLIDLRKEIAETAPSPLQPIYTSLAGQAQTVRKVIAAFARHPHRNQILGRASTISEKGYIAKGDFPQLYVFQDLKN